MTTDLAPASTHYCPICDFRTTDSAMSYCPQDGARLIPEAAADQPMVGSIFVDRYRVLRRIGSGGMADVYEVERLDNSRHLALKLLKRGFMDDEEANDRFRHEAMLISRIAHPNIVAIEDFGTSSDQGHYMVMEVLEGMSLRDAIDQHTLSVEAGLRVLLQVCEGIAAAHERGVLHRDLKPDNVFLQQGHSPDAPVVKVLDLGIGKLFGAGTDARRLTLAGRVVGTPAYMSPEQCRGDETTERSDVYSLGIMLYELLTHQLPFDDESIIGVMMMHINSPFVYDRDLAEVLDLPDGTFDVIGRALAKDPPERQSSVLELQKDIAGLLTRTRHRRSSTVLSSSSRASSELSIAATVSAPSSVSSTPRRIPLETCEGRDLDIAELGPGVYWVGRRHGEVLECNVYLKVFDTGAGLVSMLIDPGPLRDMDTVLTKVTSIIGDIRNLNYIFINHQDPDVCGSAGTIQQMSGSAFIICSEDTFRLARFQGLDPKRFISTESLPGGHLSFGSGQFLRFIPTPFCHFRGAVAVFDAAAGILFSGDLFGGASAPAHLVATDVDTFKGVARFHQIYMPSRRAVDRALRSIQALTTPIRILAPQHGAIAVGDQVVRLLALVAGLTLGMDMVEQNEAHPGALRVANRMVQTYREIAGPVSWQRLISGTTLDRSFSSVVEFGDRGDIAAFRIPSRDAIDWLLGEMMRAAPPELEDRLLLALAGLHTELRPPK